MILEGDINLPRTLWSSLKTSENAIADLLEKTTLRSVSLSLRSVASWYRSQKRLVSVAKLAIWHQNHFCGTDRKCDRSHLPWDRSQSKTLGIGFIRMRSVSPLWDRSQVMWDRYQRCPIGRRSLSLEIGNRDLRSVSSPWDRSQWTSDRSQDQNHFEIGTKVLGSVAGYKNEKIRYFKEF